MDKNQIKQSTVVLMSIILLAKLTGMFRDVVLANYFGTTNVSDAYLIAVSVPTLLFYFVGHALSTAFLPMFNKVRFKQGIDSALKYSNSLMVVSLMVCLVIVIMLTLFPSYFVRVFANGFDEETVVLTSKYIRTSSVCLLIMTVINIFTGFLQANSNFVVPAMVSFPRNIVFIISIIIAAKTNAYILGFGILFAYFSEFCLLFPFVLKNGYRFNLGLDFRSTEMKETLNVVIPIFIGVGVSQINKVVDKSIASTVITGGISALSYAAIINNAVQEVIVTGIITVLFARCSSWVAEEKHETVKEKLSETIQTLSLLLVPASFGVIALSKLIVDCVFSRGAFNSSSVNMTAGALCCYTVGLCFLAVRDTLIKVFYAYKETRITTITSVFSIIVNIVLNIILSRIWGINGLAIATSIAAIVQCSILYVVLRRKIGDYGLSTQLSSWIRIIVASILMFVIVSFAVRWLGMIGVSRLLQLVIGVLCGACVYMIVVLLFRVPIALKGINSLYVRFNHQRH